MRSMFRLHSTKVRNTSGDQGAGGNTQAVLEITPMRRRDLKNVIAIERRIFPSPWSIGLYMSEIAQPATRAYYVASVGTELVGYAGMMVVVGEAHVTNIGVAPEWQRCGVGRRLLFDPRPRGAPSLGQAPHLGGAGDERGRPRPSTTEFGFAPQG